MHTHEENPPATSPPRRLIRPSINLRNAMLCTTSPEKDSDDPTSSNNQPSSLHRLISDTRTNLNSLFSSQTSPSEDSSRQPSFQFGGLSSEASHFNKHIFNKGLLEGRFSDVCVYVFGTKYRLHRLILDQSQFFSAAFSGLWSESSSGDICLKPEDSDPNITQESFEIAIKELYGYRSLDLQAFNCLALFATACWLGMHELKLKCVEDIIKTMQPFDLADVVEFFTSNYYGNEGENVLDAVNLVLLREGSSTPLEAWDGVPSEIIRDTVASDQFFIHDEWHRWELATSILDRKLFLVASELGIDFKQVASREILDQLIQTDLPPRDAIRITQNKNYDEDILQQLSSVYNNPEIIPLLDGVGSAIHYIYFDEAQLQQVKAARDIFGLPFIPASTLHLFIAAAERLKGWVVALECDQDSLNLERKAKDWSTQICGGESLSGRIPRRSRHLQLQLDSNSAQPINNSVPRRFDSMKSKDNVDSDMTLNIAEISDCKENRTQFLFTPFRFSVEFMAPRILRGPFDQLHSRYVFYAGSFWSIYVRRKWMHNELRHALYLRRIKASPEHIMSDFWGLLDYYKTLPRFERSKIRQIVQHSIREQRHGRLLEGGDYDTELATTETWRSLLFESPCPEDEQARSITYFVESLFKFCSRTLDHTIESNLDASGSDHHPMGAPFATQALPHMSDPFRNDATWQRDVDYFGNSNLSQILDKLAAADTDVEPKGFATASSTLQNPPYVDQRSAVKAYFKIFYINPNGKALDIHESVPEVFSDKRSWGWRQTNISHHVRHQDSSDLHLFDTPRNDGKIKLSVAIGLV